MRKLKTPFRLVIVLIGTIGILSVVFYDAFVNYPETPLYALGMFGYFTIQSNLIAVIYFWVIFSLKMDEKSELWNKLIGAVVVYTTITFLVYATLLEPLYQETGLWLLGSICMHYINPILIIAYVIIYRKEHNASLKDALYWIIYPSLYLLGLLIVGLITNSFIYPFFQISEVGVLRFVLMIFGLVGLFLLLSFTIVKILSKK